MHVIMQIKMSHHTLILSICLNSKYFVAISVSTRLPHRPHYHFRTLKEGLYLALLTRTLIKNIKNQIQSSMARLIEIGQLYTCLVSVVRGGVCAGQYLCSVEEVSNAVILQIRKAIQTIRTITEAGGRRDGGDGGRRGRSRGAPLTGGGRRLYVSIDSGTM